MSKSIFVIALLALVAASHSTAIFPADLEVDNTVVEHMRDFRCPNRCRSGSGARFNARRECKTMPGCTPRRCMKGPKADGTMRRGWKCGRKIRIVDEVDPSVTPEAMEWGAGVWGEMWKAMEMKFSRAGLRRIFSLAELSIDLYFNM